MSDLSRLFGPPETAPSNPIASSPAELPPPPANPSTQRIEPPQPTSVDSAKGDDEDEALRALLADAGTKVRQFDEYRNSFASLIESATLALRTLEQEKTSNVDLRRELEQSAARYDEFRARAHETETRYAILSADHEKLRQELELARQAGRDVERSRAEHANDAMAKRGAMAELERQLGLENARVATLSADNQRLRDDSLAAEARSNRLAADVASAENKIGFLESEISSLQRAFDQVSEQATHAARRFADSETALTSTKTRLLQLEGQHDELRTERDRLRTALEEASARHGSDQGRTEMQIDAVRGRAAAAEKLLGETRRTLALRTEEVREAEQRTAEALYTHERLERRIAKLEADLIEQASEITELKTARDRLIEKSTAVINTLRLREIQLASAEDHAKTVTARCARLESGARESADAFERRIAQLTATLERERVDRAADGDALETAQKELDQMRADLLRLQTEANRLAVADADNVTFPSRSANAA